jgi:hypothetical protein
MVEESEPDTPPEVETYSIKEAAKVLGRTEGRIRQMLRAGELAGEHEGGDPARPWRVPKWAVHAMRDEMEERAQESTTTPRDPSVSTAALVRQVQDLQRELGRLEARAQLEERASSTIREERDRLLRERDEERRRADAERERAEEIRRELDELRSRGFWRRLFGG